MYVCVRAEPLDLPVLLCVCVRACRDCGSSCSTVYVYACVRAGTVDLPVLLCMCMCVCVQGLWIFLFYCVLKKEARNAWLRALPCCHVLDEKSGMGTTSKGEPAVDKATFCTVPFLQSRSHLVLMIAAAE